VSVLFPSFLPSFIPSYFLFPISSLHIRELSLFFPSHALPKMPKRIILCLDGTWDSADEGHPNIPSNVARLSRMIARQGTSDGSPIEQVVYYQSGVGTGALNQWDKIYQGALFWYFLCGWKISANGLWF
jgi:hypothetical protein